MCVGLPGRGRQLRSPNTPETSYDPTAATQKPSTVSIENAVTSGSARVEANQLFHYLFEQASLGIAVEDLEGKLLLANPSLCSMPGYSENELFRMSCSRSADPEDSADNWEDSGGDVELSEAKRLAGLGSWEWEPRTDTVIRSKSFTISWTSIQFCPVSCGKLGAAAAGDSGRPANRNIIRA